MPLPSPEQVRDDFTRMVEFGPRLTASPNHESYVAWLEQELEGAGLGLLPCDGYTTDRWLAEDVALTILEGPAAGAAKIATYYPRSQETPPTGVTGPLVYGGTVPTLSASGTDFAALQAAIGRYPSELQSWAQGLTGTLDGGPQGSILLVDLPMPVPLTAAAFLPAATYLNWPGHTVADWAAVDYKRVWIEPGLEHPAGAVPVDGRHRRGVHLRRLVRGARGRLRAVHDTASSRCPRCTSTATRAALCGRSRERGRRRRLPSPPPASRPRRTRSPPSCPGESDETLIFNTHTDGQGFVEENAGVAFVQLARHFASLPAHQRLKRTLVFAVWPGHMVADLPQTQGWIDTHPDLVKRAAAALTVEHLGCTEWIDTARSGLSRRPATPSCSGSGPRRGRCSS